MNRYSNSRHQVVVIYLIRREDFAEKRASTGVVLSAGQPQRKVFSDSQGGVRVRRSA